MCQADTFEDRDAVRKNFDQLVRDEKDATTVLVHMSINGHFDHIWPCMAIAFIDRSGLYARSLSQRVYRVCSERALSVSE